MALSGVGLKASGVKPCHSNAVASGTPLVLPGKSASHGRFVFGQKRPSASSRMGPGLIGFETGVTGGGSQRSPTPLKSLSA